MLANIGGGGLLGPATGLRGALGRGAGVAFFAAILFSPAALSPTALADGSGGYVDVLFYFSEDYYVWGRASAAGTVDAVSASHSAASDIDKAFYYDDAGSPATVEIGGLSPPPDSWVWSLLRWNDSGGHWERWSGSARELSLRAGDGIAWCPSDLLPPAPDPITRYPWPMFRSTPGRAGASLSPAPLSNLTYWTTELGASVDSSPCVAGGRVFVLGGGEGLERSRLFCLNETTGAVLWQKNLTASGRQYSSPAYHDGRVYFGLSDGRLLAVVASTGEIVWEFATRSSELGVSSSPAVSRGLVVFGAGDGFVYCLNTTGGKLWERDTGGPIHLCSPAVKRGVVVIGNERGRLLCLNLSDGEVAWSAELGGRIRATPAISHEKSEDYVFVSVLREELGYLSLYQFYIPDGTYQFNTTYPASTSSPALLGGGLFIGTATEFVGHHPDRNRRFWGLPFAPVDTSPAGARGFIYFATTGDAGTVVCARTGGFLEWTLTGYGPFSSSPAVADGRLFICSRDGTMLCAGRPPAAKLGGGLRGPSKATEGSSVELRLSLNNTGELGATVGVWLVVDGARTSVGEGPVELLPGDSKELRLTWRAREGRHTLGVELNGTDLVLNTVVVEVERGPRTCAIVAVLGLGVWLCAPAALLMTRGGAERRRGSRGPGRGG
ncbi:MAG: outer membrane protein assembly factor BamB family protein [Thermoplasmatota archaeon]